jgi:ubiquinone/menaquinone biosynthesis C-methylase UbiE
MQRAEHALEFLDRPVSRRDREASLRDIDRLNSWFGGYWLTHRGIDRLTAGTSDDRGRLIVDVGGGAGHFARWLRRRRRAPRVAVLDREVAALPPGVLGVGADATALPLREGAVDIVTTSLTLHHLDGEAAVRCLAEMRAVARRGVVVNDLLRSRLTLGLVWLATRLLTRHHFARHDGPLSVRRAWAPDEIRTLAEKAGFSRIEIRRYPWLGRLLALLR